MIASLFVYWTLFESTLENLVITDYLLEELGFYSKLRSHYNPKGMALFTNGLNYI
jgi:hypothetical protein